jgi:hypothetical protein
MNQKERIERAVEYIGCHTDHGDQPEPCPICAKVDEALEALRSLTYPHPEASDREIAILHLGKLYGGKPGTGSWHGIKDKWSPEELIEIQVKHDATLRADERRKTNAEISSIRDDLKRANDTIAEVAAQRNRANDLIEDLLASEPSSNDPRLDYVEIQVDRNAYQDARKAIGWELYKGN